MIILDYSKKYHKEIIKAAVHALKRGKLVVYPTETCYGLACDTTQLAAVKKLYATKGRTYKKPVHVVVPTTAAVKKLVTWNTRAQKVARAFWPGSVTIVLPLKARGKNFAMLSAGLGTLGVRMPAHKIALDLAAALRRPISATSANTSGGGECYSLDEILEQFKGKKLKPDIIINAGRLPKRKPSTVLLLTGNKIELLREGPIKLKKILTHVV